VKSLYVTSVERYSGKTATCLALGKHFMAQGYKVGYMKPLSLQPWLVAGKVADEDAAFVKSALDLEAEPWELSPVVITPEYLREHLREDKPPDLMKKVKAACKLASDGKDILLLEGGGSLREGYVVGLPTPVVAEELGSCVLAIVKYRDHVRVLDDALTARARLGKAGCGMIINRVPEGALPFVKETAAPYLEKQDIAVVGILPEVRGLQALTVMEIIQVLKAEVLTERFNPEGLVETLTVGAMTAEAALSRFRRYTNKAVITGGDRTDIQLAALETSTVCLVLTGNLRPSPLIIKQAEESGVAILLVRENTLETVEAIESVFGKSRLGQTSKLAQFEALMAKHLDWDRLDKRFGLEGSGK